MSETQRPRSHHSARHTAFRPRQGLPLLRDGQPAPERVGRRCRLVGGVHDEGEEVAPEKLKSSTRRWSRPRAQASDAVDDHMRAAVVTRIVTVDPGRCINGPSYHDGVGSSSNRGPGFRILIVLPAAVMLLLGLSAGLVIMGLPIPVALDRLPELHAPLLVFGFVGTLISLERAVALRAGWAYLAPALIAGGMLLALTSLPILVGKVVVTAGLLVHLLQYFAIWRRQPMTATAVQALGAVAAITAGLAWSGGVRPAYLVPLLATFLILTIVGERLELARVGSPGERAEGALLGFAFVLAAATVLTLTVPVIAVPVAGVALLGIVVWLARYDIARMTVRQTGLPRFVAVGLLVGFAWLAVAGAGWILGGARTEGPVYDAVTHAIFLGFVITMIMVHAPLILPAVLRVAIPYHPALYAPITLLQVSLVVRVVGGDAWGLTPALQAGGIVGAIAMLLFPVTVVCVALIVGPRASRKKGARVST